MTMSSRAAMALGLAGLLGYATALHAQSDPAVRKTNVPAPATAEIPPARIGSIDVEKVLKEYKKVAASSEGIRAEVKVRQMQLTKLAEEGQKLAKELEGLDPEGPDARDRKNKMKQLQIQIESEKATAQEDFARKESEALAELYGEIQKMSELVARSKNLNFIVRISSEPISASDPNSVMSAMSRTIVYSDPQADITGDVIYQLNYRYDKMNAGKPAAAKTAAKPAARPAGAGATAPRGN